MIDAMLMKPNTSQNYLAPSVKIIYSISGNVEIKHKHGKYDLIINKTFFWKIWIISFEK